ncbi:MAG: thiamine pyrophosphate-dependent enzyme [Thermoleophilaceae bacterium]
MLDRNAVVIGDGGDFVSYAGRVIDTYEPGCWMDPGPFGCLGAGPGYALAAKLANPDRQVCLLLGDGAFGFSGMEFDTLVRHGVPVVARDGQQRDLGAREAPDGVPLRLLGGRRPAARAAATTRWWRRSAGTASWWSAPRTCSPRSSGRSQSGKPALVNVMTDPSVVYPRKSNLA